MEIQRLQVLAIEILKTNKINPRETCSLLRQMPRFAQMTLHLNIIKPLAMATRV